MKRPIIVSLLLCTALNAAPATLKVRIKGATRELPLETYVAGVVAGECSTFRSDEAIKAMAVAARSYAMNLRGRHKSEGYDLCATTHCQRIELDAVTPRLAALAAQTAGEMLWFEGKPAFACYSRSCGGTTEDGQAVWSELRAPFLRSHADPYCLRLGTGSWHWTATAAEIGAALGRAGLRAPSEIRDIQIERRTASGRAQVLVLLPRQSHAQRAHGEGAVPHEVRDSAIHSKPELRPGDGAPVRVSASSFRFAVGRALGFNTLRSDKWSVVASDAAKLTFEGTGDGHGVGMCQLGADQMGVEGHGYREILEFYYPGAVLGLTARGLAWRRSAGEFVTLISTQPDRDGAVLTVAERQVKQIADRYGWTPPAGIQLRVFPDIETFRNATGEPGWVAARTSGRRVEMQPAAVLRARGALESTLHHELLHVFVEAQAASGIPVWFREGLVGYMEHSWRGTAVAPESDIRQREDEIKARRAYAAATERVAALVRSHGEPAAIGWLKTGLPAAAK